jgi:hypothetical protein
MKDVVRQAAVALGVLLMLPSAGAAVITLTPASTPTMPGSSVLVDVSVSDLGGAVVGGFDLDVGFDPARLSLAGVSFGPALGNPASFEALTNVSLSPGIVDFSEVSLLGAAQLDALQPASFSLATLSFNAINPGTVAFTLLGTSLLSDAAGRAIPITQAAVIPEPETVFLLGLGLGALAWRRARRDAVAASGARVA